MIDPSDYLDTFDQEALMILSILATPTNNLFLLILPYKNKNIVKVPIFKLIANNS